MNKQLKRKVGKNTQQKEKPNKENKEIKEQITLRIPRPKGTTLIAQQKTQKHLETHLIKEYIHNNFTINQKHYNIEQFSIQYNIPIKEIYKQIGERQNLLANLLDTPEQLNQQFKVLTQTILNGHLETRGLIAQQVSLLLRSQGDSYKPFISSEVTKGLKLMLDGNDSMAKTLGLLMGPQGTTTNILIQGHNAHQGTEGSEAFTPDEAIQILADKGLQNHSLSEASHKNLYLEHGLNDTPEVCAKLMDQGEEPTLKIEAIEDIDIEAINEKVGHDNRREHEYAIIDNDDV